MHEHLAKDYDLWSRVSKQQNGCWHWTGTLHHTGYGVFYIKKQQFRAHRVAYFLTYGEMPEGLVVMHVCDNRLCINPEHLSLGTPSENTMDRVKKGRSASGSSINTARLTSAQADEIREQYAKGGVSQREIAERYSVTQSTVSLIVHDKTWRHS